MAGNSQRRGATRKPGTKKGATRGSGGKGKRALEGKGPTPKAEDRPYHAAAKRKAAAERGQPTSDGAGVSKPGSSTPGSSTPGSSRAGSGRAGSGRAGAVRGGGPGRATARSSSGRAASASAHRGRVKTGAEVVAGRNAVVEALRAQVPCTAVWVAHRIDSDDRVREILRLTGDLGLPLMEVTKPELDRLTDGLVHQGVAIQVPPYAYADLHDLLARADRAGQAALLMALDGVTDPRNLGAVLRSAGAFGAHGVIVPERRAAGVTAAAWKVSAGAAARVPVARVTNLVRALGELRDAGCFVVGLDGAGTMPVSGLELATDPVVLVIGSEGKGLGRLVRASCDVVASIPISSDVESLNAGVAAGISLYEVARLREARGPGATR